MFTRKTLVILTCLVVIGAAFVGQAICQSEPSQQGDQQRGRRNRGQGFDPAQMRQRMLDRMQETLGATDEEWKALGPKVEKVMTLAMESRGGMFARGGRGGRGRPEGETRPATEGPQSETANAFQALSAVLDNKDATPDEIKAALQNLRDARAKTKVELDKAQKNLREVLTLKQEAQLVQMGMLD